MATPARAKSRITRLIDVFDETKAERAVQFFNKYMVYTRGSSAGQPFVLRPWQEEPIRRLFGTIDPEDLKRQYQLSMWVLPKKNGKTALAAGLALYMISLGGEYGAEVFSAANSRDQAAEVFKCAKDAIKLCCDNNLGRLDALFEYERDVFSSPHKILYRPLNATYMPLAAESGIVQGKNPSFLIVDEIHEMRDRALIDALREGMGTREDPLSLYITNMGELGGSPVFWQEWDYAKRVLEDPTLDPNYLPVLYEAPEGMTEEQLLTEGPHWFSLNPALGDFLSVKDFRRSCREAREMPSKKQNVLRLRLCKAVQSYTAWLSTDEWDQCIDPTWKDAPLADVEECLAGRPCFVGIDLSTKLDITSAVCVFPEASGGYAILEYAWLPRERVKDLSAKCEVDFQKFADRGDLILTDGNVQDFHEIQKHVIGYLGGKFDVQQDHLDPHQAHAMMLALQEAGRTPVEITQDYNQLSEPSKEFEKAIKQKQIRHRGNRLMRWCVGHVEIASDTKDNIKPVKPKRSEAKYRIDPVVATVLGIGGAMRHQSQELTPDSVFFA